MSSTTDNNKADTIKETQVEKAINQELNNKTTSAESAKDKADEISTKHSEQNSEAEADKEKDIETKDSEALDHKVETKSFADPVESIETKATDTKIETIVAVEEDNRHAEVLKEEGKVEKEVNLVEEAKSTKEIKHSEEVKSMKEEKSVDGLKISKEEKLAEQVENVKKEERSVDDAKGAKEENPAEQVENVKKEERSVDDAKGAKEENPADQAKSTKEHDDSVESELKEAETLSTIVQEAIQETDTKKDESSKIEKVESVKPAKIEGEVASAAEIKKAPVEPTKDKATSLLDELEAELSSLKLTEAEAKELADEDEEEGDYPLIELFASSVSGNRTIKSHIRKIEDAFESHDIEYTYMDTASDEQAKLYLKRKSPHPGALPQIFVDGRFKCLYEEFANVLENGDLYDYFEIDPEA